MHAKPESFRESHEARVDLIRKQLNCHKQAGEVSGSEPWKLHIYKGFETPQVHLEPGLEIEDSYIYLFQLLNDVPFLIPHFEMYFEDYHAVLAKVSTRGLVPPKFVDHYIDGEEDRFKMYRGKVLITDLLEDSNLFQSPEEINPEFNKYDPVARLKLERIDSIRQNDYVKLASLLWLINLLRTQFELPPRKRWEKAPKKKPLADNFFTQVAYLRGILARPDFYEGEYRADTILMNLFRMFGENFYEYQEAILYAFDVLEQRDELEREQKYDDEDEDDLEF